MTSDSEATSEPSKTPELEIPPTKHKRLKTQENSELEYNEQDESPSPSSMDSETKTCGVCLLEEGKSVRGFIDGCDHHFCFVCIMEWARVETRCPLCKCRFTTIRRPPIDDIFPSDRIVNVPVRNQDYYIHGITTISHSDPYSQFQCSVCHSMTDESLVILCNLCDWGAHTYCVGLGTTIPDGDWFCQDCAVSRAESHVSIFDIVRESIIPDMEEPHTVASPHQDHFFLTNEATQPGARAVYNVVDGASELSGGTVRCRQNVHARIQALRENWNALRGHPHSSSSTTCQQLASQVSCPADNLHNRGTEDIKKAWKLMDIAKSTHQTCKRTITVHQPAKYGIGEGNTPRDLFNINSNFLVSRNQPVQARELVNVAKDNRNLSIGLESEKHICQKYEKQKQVKVPAKEALKFDDILPTTYSERHFNLLSSRKVLTLVHNDACNGYVNERDGYACLSSPVGSQTGASDLFHAKSELRAMSSCRVDVSRGKVTVENGFSQRKISKEDNAKSEIQSLVKLNIKLLNRSKNLGIDEFKEVARLSTHSIMAACGLENPKPGVPSFACCVCRHNEKIHKVRRSTLMPNSCRECFYIFVKDVVKSIMFEKAGHG